MFSQRSSFNEAYNFNNPLEKQEVSYLSNQKKKSQQPHYKGNKIDKTKFHFRIGVIKKVATFLQNLKSSIVLNQPKLKPQQKYYLDNEIEYKQNDNLIPYQSTMYIIFQLILLIIIIFNIWKNSYELFISNDLLSNNYTEIITIVLYLLYMLLYQNTQLKNEKLQLISNRKQIFNYYLYQKFIFDIFVVLGLIINLSSLDQKADALYSLSRLFVLGMLPLVSQIITKLQNIYGVSSEMQSLFGIMKLFIKIFTVVHCMALFLCIFAKFQKSEGLEKTWIETNSLKYTNPNNLQFEIYIYAWYWSSTIISTVGFGDIIPGNVYQRVIISILEVLCCVGFGYFVNYIGSLIGMLGQSKASYQKDIRKLNKYLKQLFISDNLKTNIRSHFFNKYQLQQLYSPQNQKKIFSKMTQKLKQQLIQQNNFKILKDSKLLSIFNDGFLKKLAMKLIKVVYGTQEILYNPKKKQIKLWIIEEGLINQLPYRKKQLQYKDNLPMKNQQKSEKILTKYYNCKKDNSCNTVGWINFITGRNYYTQAVVDKFTIGYQLDREQFINILKDTSYQSNEEQKQNQFNQFKFYQLKENMINNKYYYTKKCLACDRFTHNVIQCSRLHFKPKKILSILIKEKSREFLNDQIRRLYKRRVNKTKWKGKIQNDGVKIAALITNKKRSSIFISKDCIEQHRDSNKYQSIGNRISLDNFIRHSQKFKPINLNQNLSLIVQETENSDRSKSMNEANLIGQNFSEFENQFDKILMSQNKYFFQAHQSKQVLKEYINAKKRKFNKTANIRKVNNPVPTNKCIKIISQE